MTPAQLEQQSRDAVIAYLQDSSVWLEWTAEYERRGYELVWYRICKHCGARK